MSELGEQGQIVREPIGVHLLGEVDPRILTKEQFDESDGLLFHGGLKDFKFLPVYDYRSADYLTTSDGSQTLGEGFYATDDREVAANYSLVRQSHKEEEAEIVVALLPFQAQMLDLRGKDDPKKNAPVPPELFEKWFQYFKSYYFNKEARKNLPWYTQANEAEYFPYLVRARQLPQVDLRVMLETAPSPQLKSRNLPSPPWMKLFSNFMLEQGYDGLIYIEGGEGPQRKVHTTYVFYNLNKLGTYDSWQSS